MRKLTLITALAVVVVAASAALMLGMLRPTGAVGASEQQSVVGELTIEGLNNQPIPVLAYSWGASIPVSDDGGGAGKAILEDVSVTKVMDALTPALFGAVVQGRHFPLANLVVNGAGAGPTHRYFLEEVLITSISHGGSGGDKQLTENLTLTFAAIELRNLG